MIAEIERVMVTSLFNLSKAETEKYIYSQVARKLYDLNYTFQQAPFQLIAKHVQNAKLRLSFLFQLLSNWLVISRELFL